MGFEPVTSRYRCDTLPTELWSHCCWEQVNCGFIGSCEKNEYSWYMKNYIWTVEMKWKWNENEMKMKWSSQLTQFMQLRKEAWKKFRTSIKNEKLEYRWGEWFSEWRTQDVGDSIKAALKLRSVLTKEGRWSLKVFQAICSKKAEKYGNP